MFAVAVAGHYLLTCCNRFTLTAFRFFFLLFCKAGLSLIILAKIFIVVVVAVVAAVTVVVCLKVVVLKFTSALILTGTLVFHF